MPHDKFQCAKICVLKFLIRVYTFERTLNVGYDSIAIGVVLAFVIGSFVSFLVLRFNTRIAVLSFGSVVVNID